jgi:alpha-beta hydrolase superfamily lysophospholipase
MSGERIGPDQPFLLVGYSSVGPLVLKSALDEVERRNGPRLTRLVLISPMIGVAPFAWLARVISLLGPIPYFEKARWLDVMPEYNPFKYNSFPANAALQSWRLSSDVQAQILRLAKAGRLKNLPPVLAFQSLVDATVSTAAVVPRCSISSTATDRSSCFSTSTGCRGWSRSSTRHPP